MFNQKPIVVLFIDRNRFMLLGGNLTGIVTLDVPEVLIRDLEVVGKDGLYTLIKQWVKQYSITGSHLVVIFSERTYFEKIFPIKEQTQIESNILKFFDMVPLETIWSKVYDTDKGKRAVAISKSLYEAVHQGFALQGLPTKAVIPAFTLGAMSGKRQLDRELFEYVMKNIDALTKQSMLDTQELAAPSSEQQTQGVPASKPKSSLPLLLGVFGVLMAILVIVVVLSMRAT